MRFTNTLPVIAAALVAGASSVLANDSADPSTGAVYASQDNAGTVEYSTKNAAWKEVRHFVGGYNFFELLNYPGAREHRHAHTHAQSDTPSGTEPSTPATPSADLAAGSSDAQLQPQERDFEDMEELEERKNHKKKHSGNKKKKHRGQRWWKKKHNSHKKNHNKKNHNKKNHNKKQHNKKNGRKRDKKDGHKRDKKRHHKREEDAMDLVVRAYYAGDIDTRMFDELVERYNVVGDSYLDAREFVAIDDLEARELGELLWD